MTLLLSCRRRPGTSTGGTSAGNMSARAACRLQGFDDHERTKHYETVLSRKFSAEPNARLNGAADPSKRLPNTANISFEYVEGQNILTHLDKAGICVSTGSACHSSTKQSSPTLRAMNVPFTAAQGSIRFSLGRYNTVEDVDHTLSVLPGIIDELVAMSPYDKGASSTFCFEMTG